MKVQPFRFAVLAVGVELCAREDELDGAAGEPSDWSAGKRVALCCLQLKDCSLEASCYIVLGPTDWELLAGVRVGRRGLRDGLRDQPVEARERGGESHY